MSRYKVILADPPWNYANAGCRGAAENEYKTMSDEEIYNLPIAECADNDCVLLLWATWPKLKEAMMTVSKWGFEYITGFPWIKVSSVSNNIFGDIEIKSPYGIGFWVRGCSEPILICRRGRPKPPPDGFVGLLSPNMFHSRKPDSIYAYAESMDGPYLELFARRKRDGWDSHGDQLK